MSTLHFQSELTHHRPTFHTASSHLGLMGTGIGDDVFLLLTFNWLLKTPVTDGKLSGIF